MGGGEAEKAVNLFASLAEGKQESSHCLYVEINFLQSPADCPSMIRVPMDSGKDSLCSKEE